MSLRVTATVSETDKHSNDVTGLCFHDGKLYSAAEDGKVKVWTPELRKLAEFRAHDSAVFHLAALGDQLYTCSNDGSAVQAWDAASGERRTTLLGGGAEVWRLHAHDGKLYAGDAQGVVRIWSGDVLVRSFELTEEVRGLAVQGNLIYTVRDRDLVITETLAGEKSGPVTRQTIEGSSPLCLVGTRVCFASRSGVDILVHDNSKETRFKQLGIIKVELKKTGGGGYVPKLSCIEARVMALVNSQFTPLNCKYDSDAIYQGDLEDCEQILVEQPCDLDEYYLENNSPSSGIEAVAVTTMYPTTSADHMFVPAAMIPTPMTSTVTVSVPAIATSTPTTSAQTVSKTTGLRAVSQKMTEVPATPSTSGKVSGSNISLRTFRRGQSAKRKRSDVAETIYCNAMGNSDCQQKKLEMAEELHKKKLEIMEKESNIKDTELKIKSIELEIKQVELQVMRKKLKQC
ncbi:uncharacterized protein LOC134533925 isoform X1 [Bacillus rossius redtenbacheri]|uniref:uncharacterized protein LOC134533925 isoform X1 n=1 Tax=Bacillus rossius redtenbacheri TaxID=93214 RepID=UPI002FDD0F66